MRGCRCRLARCCARESRSHGTPCRAQIRDRRTDGRRAGGAPSHPGAPEREPAAGWRESWGQYMKSNRARCDPGPLLSGWCSDLANVLRLQPLWTLGDVELDVVALGEATGALRLDRCGGDEHVWTRLLRDKAKAFRVVKPLHLTLCHTVKTSAQWGTAPDGNDPRHRGRGTGSNKNPRDIWSSRSADIR